MDEWKSVKEAPEEDAFYLCWCANCPAQSPRFQVLRFRASDKIWLSTFDPTHWMPLPEPPVE